MFSENVTWLLVCGFGMKTVEEAIELRCMRKRKTEGEKIIVVDGGGNGVYIRGEVLCLFVYTKGESEIVKKIKRHVRRGFD